MKFKPLVICVGLLCMTVSQAIAQFTTAASYPFKASSVTYTALSGGTSVPSGTGVNSQPSPTSFVDDEVLSTIPIGFGFKYCGVTYSTLYACSNGFVSFVQPTNPGTHWYDDNSMGYLSALGPSLIPQWDNLDGWPGIGSATYTTTGAAPYRVFTLEYKNWGYTAAGAVAGGVISFQVILYENGNNVEFRYSRVGAANIPTSTGGCSIGIAGSASDYQSLPSSATNPTPSTSSFTTNITAKPATGQSYLWGCMINITANPSNVNICAGSNTSFSCTTSTAGAAFQWQVDPGTGTYTDILNGGIYSNATTNTLNLTNITAGMDGYKYRCMISTTGTGGCSMVTGFATLTTGNRATVITTQPPLTQVTCEKTSNSDTLYIPLTADGTALSYQWQVDPGTGVFANIAAALPYNTPSITSNTLKIIKPTVAVNNYKYRCIITGVCIPLTITSDPCTVTVNALPVVSTNPASQTICPGANVTFSVVSTNTVAYQWQEDNGSGFTDITNGGIYSGATTASLKLANTPFLFNGFKYRCVVNNTSATCPVTSGAATLTVRTLPVVTVQPVDVYICNGSNTSFSIAATGSNLVYKWQEDPGTGVFSNITDGGVYSGSTTTTLSLTAAPVAMYAFKYRCVISASTCAPSTISANAALMIYNPHTAVTQPLNATVCVGSPAKFFVAAQGGPLTYQWQEKSPTDLVFTDINTSGLYAGYKSDTLTVPSPTAMLNGYKYRCIVSGVCNYYFSGSALLTVNEYPNIVTTPASVSTCDSVFTQIGIKATGSLLSYQWQLDAGTGFSNIPTSAQYGGVNTDSLKLSKPTGILSGNLYRVVINGACGNPLTSSAIPLTVNAFPEIVTQPADDIVIAGHQATFSTSATGTSVSYQWQVNELDGAGFKNLFDNSSNQGAKTGTLIITGTFMSKNGYQYRCLAKGLCGKDDISDTAKLTVTADPSGIDIFGKQNSNIALYPNPVTGTEAKLVVKGSADTKVVIKIIDQLGRLQMESPLEIKNNSATLDLSSLAPGMYFIQVSSDQYIQPSSLSFIKK